MDQENPSKVETFRPGAASIWSAMLAVYIVWGSTYLAIRFAVETIPPFLMAGFRFVVAGIILIAWRRLAGDARPTRIEWKSSAIVGLFLLVLGNGGVVWAEQFVPSGIAALVVGSVPLWMLVIDALRKGGKWPRPMIITGILIGFGGIVLLLWPAKSTDPLSINFAGSIVLIFAAVAWAIGSLYSRKAPLPASPLLGTGMEMLTGGVGLVALGLITGEPASLNFSSISTQSLLGLGYLIIFGSLVGFASYTWLLRNAPTSLVSTYAYVNPLIAIIIGYLLADEVVTWRTILAALVILGSVLLTTRPAGRKIEDI